MRGYGDDRGIAPVGVVQAVDEVDVPWAARPRAGREFFGKLGFGSGGEGGRFCSLEPKVVVNHGGSVLMKEPIDFGEQGYLPLTESTEPNFLGKSQTLADFLHNDSPQESEVMKLC